MKSSSEYRAAAWKTLREGGWVVKFMVVWMSLAVLFAPVEFGWACAVKALGIQTWGMFLQAKFQALTSGLDLVVPSRTIAFRMTEASAFKTFVTCIVNGILAFGLMGLFLRAAKGGCERWFAPSFEGFKYPLGVAWLYFRLVLQIALWSLLFVIPGVVAYYRYSQCWYLKVENPDWPAGKCLAESARMMDGHKWRRFCLDLSYWKQVGLLLFGLMALGVLNVLQSSLGNAVAFALTVACVWGGIVLSAYIAVGQALFYLDLKKRGEGEDPR